MTDYLITPDGREWIPREVGPAQEWWYILPDYLQGDTSYHYQPPEIMIREAAVKLGGAPDVFRTGNLGRHKDYRKVRYREYMQRYNADLMAVMVYDDLLENLNDEQYNDIAAAHHGWGHNNTAYFNKTGFENKETHYTDYIRRPFEQGEEDPLFNPLINGTSSVQGEVVEYNRSYRLLSIARNILSWGIVKASAKYYLRLKSFQPGDELPEITNRDIFNDPRIAFATVIRNKKLEDGTWSVNKFPRLEGGYGVPYALFTMEDHYFPLWYDKGDCLRKVISIKRPDMYNPSREWPF